MIILKGISRIYNPKKGVPVKALDKVDLMLPDKGMVFILGKSGSGKSTLLNVVGGLDKYDEGDLIIKDKSTKNFNQNDFDSYRNTMVGFIFQEYNVLDDFTVAQNIGLALELQGIKVTNERVNEILELVDLQGLGARKPNELSGGQKQRVAIARALVKQPEIIMADEPTGALDSETGRQILETLKNLSKSRLVMVVSHDREFATTYGDRIVEFMDGKIISDISRTTSLESKDTPFEIVSDNLEIKAGYTLTEQDLKVINEYLQNSKSSLKVSLAHGKNKSSFTNTDTESIVLSEESYKPIKSRLPFKSSLKIGASSLKHKRIRLAISIILAAVSLTLFGLSDTFATYNPKKAAEVSIKEAGLEYYTINKYNKAGESQWQWNSLHMFQEDIDEINTKYPTAEFIGVFNDNSLYSFQNNFHDTPTELESQIYDFGLAGLAELKGSHLSSQKINLVAGRLPQSDDEIVISKFVYTYFEKFGYKDKNTYSKVIINNYNQLLNKDFEISSKTFKIVGIIDTKIDMSKYDGLYDDSISDQKRYALLRKFDSELSSGLHKVFFVNEGYSSANVKSPGISKYGSNYGIQLFYDLDIDMYFESIRAIKDNDENKVVHFKNIGEQLEGTDILISYPTLSQLFINEGIDVYDIITTYRRSYVNSLDFSTYIEQPLRKRGLITGIVTEEEQINYYYDFYNIFYDEWSNESPPANLKSKAELSKEALTNVISNHNFYAGKIYYTDYSTSEMKRIGYDIRIAGVYFEEFSLYGAPNDAYFGQYFYDEFNFHEEGIYKMAVSYDSGNDKLLSGLLAYHFEKSGVSYVFINEVTDVLNSIDYLIQTLAKAFIYIGIGFAVFASLMLLNFISISVSYKKQEIGILRAIGARGTDVLGIFTKEATIIALINYALALVFTIAAVIGINSAFKNSLNLPISILYFGIRQIVLMLVVSIFVALASSAIPVIKTARKRPIDAIKNL